MIYLAFWTLSDFSAPFGCVVTFLELWPLVVDQDLISKLN